MGMLYLLDTNILVHLARQDALGQYLHRAYALLTCEPRPLISPIVEGELRSLAYQWQWGRPKKEQARFLLGFFARAPLDDEAVLENYALLDAYCERSGHPMGKNDLWIAAAATTFGATLLTIDRDFAPLSPTYLQLALIDPAAAN